MIDNRGLDTIKKLHSSGLQSSTSKRLYEIKKKLTYNKKVPIGWIEYENKDDANLYNIDFSKAHRILILGSSGTGKSFLARGIMNRAFMGGIVPVIMTDCAPEYFCLSGDTKILIDNQYTLLSSLSGVVNTKSWDFDKNNIVDSKSKIINSGQKEVFEISLDDGVKIKATNEHRFFINEMGKIVEKKLKDIKEGDEMVIVDDF